MTRTELAEARDRKALVLVPTGSIEQHGDHLPVDTDVRLATEMATRAAARMTDMPVVVAPSVPFGFAPHHLSLPGTISLRLETYLALLGDMARSIIGAGFGRVMFVNGHGGNSAPLRALAGQLITDGLPVGMVDYFAPSERDLPGYLHGTLPRPGHACEQETALMLHVCPGAEAADIADRVQGLPPRDTQPWIAPGHEEDPITAFGAGWAAIFQADDCGYFGDPGAATAKTGAEIAEITVDRLAAFLTAFARTPLRLGVASDPAAPQIAPPLV
ncbi:creatininase family protein [Rhodophyticola sp. CCM32]|nr:creatininase family protein [Rhodophyticola sp. CCM32]